MLKFLIFLFQKYYEVLSRISNFKYVIDSRLLNTCSNVAKHLKFSLLV